MAKQRRSEMTPEDLRIARAASRAYYQVRRERERPLRELANRQRVVDRLDRQAVSREWRAVSRAEHALDRGFRMGCAVDELYRRWQAWKTAERLLDRLRAEQPGEANADA